MEYDDGALAFRLRQELRGDVDFDRFHQENMYEIDVNDFSEAEVNAKIDAFNRKWGTYALLYKGKLYVYVVAGNGKITNLKTCGKFCNKFLSCDSLEGHKGKTFRGEDCTGKGLFVPIFQVCHKLGCPRCYESAASREAHKIDVRLKEGSKHWGLVEHLSASVPLKYYHLPLEISRHIIEKALKRRGVVGSCLIPHGFRYDESGKRWFWSPHWHVLCFLFGGYSRCRKCEDKKCEGKNKEYLRCDGFEARTRRCFFENDGVIVKVAEQKIVQDGVVVKVKGERKDVFETARYLLSHASVRVGVKRTQAVFWSGVCSTRKLKVTVERRKALCKICGKEMVVMQSVCGVGLDNFELMLSILNRSSLSREFLDRLFDDKGNVRYVKCSDSSKAGVDVCG